MIYVIIETSTYQNSPKIVDGRLQPGYFTEEEKCDRAIQTILNNMKEDGLNPIQTVNNLNMWVACKGDLYIELRKVCLYPGAVDNSGS